MSWLTDPVGWWITPFADNPFLRDALWAALLTVVCTSVIGTWVVLRGLSFLGDALAHGVLPGIAIAFVMGGNTTIGALLAALAMVAGVQLIRTASPLPDDASIGVLFVGFLALAVVVMSAQTGRGAGDLTRFLFGSINAVDAADLRTLAIVAAITVGGVVVLHRALLVTTFDVTQARLMGFRPQLTHFVLLVLLALSIVASFETVGSLLVFAFLIAPPATASMIVGRVPLIMVVAVGIGSVSAVIGLLISYHHATATGATMALVTVIVFVAALVVRSARRLARR
ncbi:metal ABC transporter permease [Ilumatobacter sp.]|uniref:metal ABC transporter permease n=1 Tax=Ilumatobacter sp. TaxID=1967498 RepID=UPI003AF57262